MSKPYAYRYTAQDKYDAYMPNKPHFINNNYDVSGRSDKFHLSHSYTYSYKGCYMDTNGISKMDSKVSSHGYFIDNYYIGKSDES
jgi:hypothetical protein